MRKRCMRISRYALWSFVVGLSFLIPIELTHGGGAQEILDGVQLRGGLIAHVGCGEGDLITELAARFPGLVHGLDQDERNVLLAREKLRELGLYGRVSVQRFDGRRLPYAENLVNLLVAENLDSVSMEEAMRVVVPGGLLCLKEKSSLKKIRRPLDEDTDEWTHYLHDPSGNAVAHDQRVGPPRQMQWIMGPPHTRSHEHTPSINALVSSGGRIFYVADQAPIVCLRRPAEWTLVARDAYNGLLLWEVPFQPWFPRLLNWGRTPYQLQRRMVATPQSVYVTLGFHAPLSRLDAASGESLKVFEGTRGTEEVLLHQEILLVVVREVTPQRAAELGKWERLSLEEGSPLHDRDSADPFVKTFQRTENAAGRTILALDASTGDTLWQREGKETEGLRGLSLCAWEDKVFYQCGNTIHSLDLRKGETHWTREAIGLRMVWRDRLLCTNGETVMALDVATGEPLWSTDSALCDIRDNFVVDGVLWLGGFKPWQGKKKGKRGPAWGPYYVSKIDLKEGTFLELLEQKNPGHHHRCWRNKATDRFILGGRRGTEFIDLETGEVLWHSWVRGVCRYGIMPANGLLYSPPHACGCYAAAKLTGFSALSAGDVEAREETRLQEHPGLEKGPAYKKRSRKENLSVAQDWPTYRQNSLRSGSTSEAVPSSLSCLWEAEAGGMLTAPTVKDGRVFVCDSEGHAVHALSAEDGGIQWTFQAGGRVGSPPTVWKDKVLFGSHDGYVYALRAAKGTLAWRLLASREQRLITAFGQLEAARPVMGSLLVNNDVLTFTGGRSSYLDAGIDLYRVDPGTGKELSRTPLYSPDQATGKPPSQYGPNAMPGARADTLSCDEEFIYLRDLVFDAEGQAKEKGNPHLFTMTSFLDDTWPHRAYWVFGAHCSMSTGCSRRDDGLIYARMMVFDDDILYGYGRADVHWSNHLRDGSYRLFAMDRESKEKTWSRTLDVHARAMVLAGDVLFVAGPHIHPFGGFDPDKDGVLLAISAKDGRELGRFVLSAPPVFDGMAAARGRLYLSLQNGSVVSLG